MTDRDLTLALAVLSQPTRFRIVRSLIGPEGREGLHAGEVADRIGRSHSGTAVHLKELERAGLLVSEQTGQAIVFRPDPEAFTALVSGLSRALGLAPDGARV